MLGSLKALTKYRDQQVRVRFDDGPVERLPVTTLSVANGRYFGGGLKVAPQADVSDGLFDVTIWSGYGLTDFVLRSAAVYSGDHVRWKGTRTLRCTRVTAESDEHVLIDCDGEQPGRLPCTMTLLPAAIRLKV
jgi:diacylglycerol kinase family enzyme